RKRIDVPTARAKNVVEGPWGDALQYWLKTRDLRQADVVRASGLQPKTISRVARGLHTQTRVLASIAMFLGVPIEHILVSPLRSAASPDETKRWFEAAVAKAMAPVRAPDDLDEDVLATARLLNRMPKDFRESIGNLVRQYDSMGLRHGTHA